MSEFITTNYIWILIIAIVLVMTVIGYIADKTDFGKKTEKVVKEKPVKEKKVKEEKIEEVVSEDLEETLPKEEINVVNDFPYEDTETEEETNEVEQVEDEMDLNPKEDDFSFDEELEPVSPVNLEEIEEPTEELVEEPVVEENQEEIQQNSKCEGHRKLSKGNYSVETGSGSIQPCVSASFNQKEGSCSFKAG